MNVTANTLYTAIENLDLETVLKLAVEGEHMMTIEGPLSDLEEEPVSGVARTELPGTFLPLTDRQTIYSPCTNSGTMYSVGVESAR